MPVLEEPPAPPGFVLESPAMGDDTPTPPPGFQLEERPSRYPVAPDNPPAPTLASELAREKQEAESHESTKYLELQQVEKLHPANLYPGLVNKATPQYEGQPMEPMTPDEQMTLYKAYRNYNIANRSARDVEQAAKNIDPSVLRDDQKAKGALGSVASEAITALRQSPLVRAPMEAYQHATGQGDWDAVEGQFDIQAQQSQAAHEVHPYAAPVGAGVGFMGRPEVVTTTIATGGVAGPMAQGATAAGRVAIGAGAAGVSMGGIQTFDQAVAGQPVTPVKNFLVNAAGGAAGAAGGEIVGGVLSKAFIQANPGKAAAIKFMSGLGTAGGVQAGMGAADGQTSPDQIIGNILAGASQHVALGGAELVGELKSARETLAAAPPNPEVDAAIARIARYETALGERDTAQGQKIADTAAPVPPPGFTLETQTPEQSSPANHATPEHWMMEFIRNKQQTLERAAPPVAPPVPALPKETPHEAQVPVRETQGQVPQAQSPGVDELPAPRTDAGKEVLTHQSGGVTEKIKEPWQMTLAEFRESPRLDANHPSPGEAWGTSREALAKSEQRHKIEVETALHEGKPVPPEVLADYPELKPPAPVLPNTKAVDDSGNPQLYYHGTTADISKFKAQQFFTTDARDAALRAGKNGKVYSVLLDIRTPHNGKGDAPSVDDPVRGGVAHDGVIGAKQSDTGTRWAIPFTGEQVHIVGSKSAAEYLKPPAPEPVGASEASPKSAGAAEVSKAAEVTQGKPETYMEMNRRLHKERESERVPLLAEPDKTTAEVKTVPQIMEEARRAFPAETETPSRLTAEQKTAMETEWKTLTDRALKQDGTPKKNAKPEDMARIRELRAMATKENEAARKESAFAKTQAEKKFSLETLKKHGLKLNQQVWVRSEDGTYTESGTLQGVEKFGPDGEPKFSIKEIRGGTHLWSPENVSGTKPEAPAIQPAPKMTESLRQDNATITSGKFKGSKGRVKSTTPEGAASITFTDANHVERTMIFKSGEWAKDSGKSLGPGAAASVDPAFRAIAGDHEPVPEDAPRIIKAVTSEPADAARKSTIIGRLLQGAANAYEGRSTAVKEAYTAAKDELARLGQRAFPALNRESPEASSAASALTAIPETKAAMLDEWQSHLKAIAKANNMPLDEFRRLVGAAMTEDQLQGVRDGHLEAGDAAAAAKVKTTFGAEDSPFKTEQDYQDAQHNDAVKEAAGYIRQAVEPALTSLYKSSSKWNATDEEGNPIEPPIRGKDFGLHLSLNPIISGEMAATGNKLKPGGNIRNTLEKHSILEKKATGAADSYELDLFKNLENALNKSILPGTHARFYQALQDAGVAIEGESGDRPTLNGKPTVAFDLRFKPGAKLFVRADVAPEVRNALAIDKPDRPFGALGNLLTRVQLASGVEAMSHIANQLPQLVQKPLAGGIVAETAAKISPGLGKAVRVAENLPVLKLAGILDSVGTKAYRLAFNDLNTKEQVTSLAKAGALQPPHAGSILNPLTWLGRGVKGLTNSMRLALDDGFKLAVDANIGIKNTEANRRDYVNQAGNYHRESSATLVRWLKDSGFGPFATAGTARISQGYRMLAGFAPGVEGSFKARTLMRVNGAAQVAGILASVALLNYMRTGKMQPAGTPIGSLYLGTDKDGKPHYEDVADLIGVRGAMRNVGADAALKPGGNIKTALKQAVSTNVGPAFGPIPTFGIEEMTGVNPHGLYQMPGTRGPRDPIANAKEALRQLNPTYAGLTDTRESGVASQFGKFGPRTGMNAEDIAKAEKPEKTAALISTLRKNPSDPAAQAELRKLTKGEQDAIRERYIQASDEIAAFHNGPHDEALAKLEQMTPEKRNAREVRSGIGMTSYLADLRARLQTEMLKAKTPADSAKLRELLGRLNKLK